MPQKRRWRDLDLPPGPVGIVRETNKTVARCLHRFRSAYRLRASEGDDGRIGQSRGRTIVIEVDGKDSGPVRRNERRGHRALAVSLWAHGTIGGGPAAGLPSVASLSRRAWRH